MVRPNRALFILILSLFASSAFASPVQWGVRGFFSGGYPSGKGLWDWTDPAQEGKLRWGAGGGGGLILEVPLKEKLSLAGEAAYVHINAGQSLDDWDIQYAQQSLEFFFLAKGMLPPEFFGTRLALGLGAMAPLEARMNGQLSEPEKPVMLCLKAGLDFPSVQGGWGVWYLSGYFVHPLTSPEYGWFEGSSGSIRINRIDLSVTWLMPGRSAE